MKRLLLAGILAVLSASPAVTQVVQPPGNGGPSVATGSVPLTYTGGDSRVSVGVDQDGNSQGELMQVFGNNGEHAIVGQLWWGHGGAGGIQADYNWLFGTTLEHARQDPDSITVAKLSFAIDQNSEKDRQANVGLSIERKEFFLNFFLSGKASGSRNAGSVSTQQQQIVGGTDETGIYTQTQTDIATTLLQAQPYSTIVGVHGGHFSDALAARFNGGIDYAKGNQGANQKRVSLGFDKYLGVRGWSVSAIAEHAQNSSAVGADNTDNRWWLFLRYEFGGGGAFRPFDDSAAANAAWIERALHEPVTGHPRSVDTYVTKGKTTTTTTLGPKHYTARVPIARDDTVSVVEGSSGVEIDVLGNDTDPDNNPLSISSAGPAGHGSVQVGPGHVLYTPTPGYTGTDAFPYTITNSKGLSASATVRITVTSGTPPNSGAPIARDDTATTPYAQPVTVAVLGNDSDPNGYPLTVTSATVPAHGASHVNGDGTITYTPNATFTGSDRFSYSIDNGHGGTASANVIITVQPPAAPVARDDAATTAYANPVDIDVLANDTDPAGYPLAVTAVTAPAYGTAKILTGGAVRYAPQVGFTGSDTFGYTISNGHGGVASAKVSVTVLPQSGTFAAHDDAATTAYATPITIDVLANDSAPTGATLVIKKITTPQHGTASFAQGKIIYTPSAAFNGGTDTFDYTVGDGIETATATVTVTVLPPGAPIARDDTATTAFATPVVIAVLANDSDPNNFALTVTSPLLHSPTHGTAQINTDNTITYTPMSTYAGGDTFAYTITNGHGGTASATVTVTVQAPVPPVALPDSATTAFKTPVTVAVLANDSDPNSLALSVTMATTPANGSVNINTNNNTITYTPAPTFAGADSFDYTIKNTQGATASATVSITVQQPPPPTANDDSATIIWNTPTVLTLSGNDTDPSGLGLKVISVTSPGHGTAVITDATAGKVTYTPINYYGGDSFKYTIEDTFHNTSTATVTLNVQPAPVTANSFTAQCQNDFPCNICLSDNISNLSELPFTLSVFPPVLTPDSTVSSPVTNGSCTSEVTYFYEGTATTDSFTFTVFDAYHTQPSIATVTVNIAP